MDERKKPKSFNRTCKGFLNTVPPKNEWYTFGTMRPDGTVSELGAKNLKGAELDKLIDWLHRVKDYNLNKEE